jgi:hypothetical protein
VPDVTSFVSKPIESLIDRVKNPGFAIIAILTLYGATVLNPGIRSTAHDLVGPHFVLLSRLLDILITLGLSCAAVTFALAIVALIIEQLWKRLRPRLGMTRLDLPTSLSQAITWRTFQRRAIYASTDAVFWAICLLLVGWLGGFHVVLHKWAVFFGLPNHTWSRVPWFLIFLMPIFGNLLAFPERLAGWAVSPAEVDKIVNDFLGEGKH